VVVGAILTLGRRTVTAILCTMRSLVRGHPSTYHRVFSRVFWPLWPLGKVLARAILRQIPADRPILVPMDDTTAQHLGKHVYGSCGDRIWNWVDRPAAGGPWPSNAIRAAGKGARRAYPLYAAWRETAVAAGADGL